MERPDSRLLLGGHLPTVPGATSLAIEGGRIAAVGSEAEIRALARRGAETVPLDGATVLPGFVEAHAHLKHHSVAQRNLDLAEAETPEAAAATVAQAVQGRPEGTWILGRGWDRNRWPNPTFPDRAPLDRAAPEHPVALFSHDGHVLWVNRRGLEKTGFWSPVPTAAGGEVLLDPDSGEPTGIVTETLAAALRERLPRPDRAETQAALERGMAHFASLGITAVHTFEGLDDLPIYQQMERDDRLPLRLLVHLAEGELDAALSLGIRSGFGSDRLRLGGVKFYLDGAIGSRTAHMLEPYLDEPDNRGTATFPRKRFEERVVQAQAGGLVPVVHAIGDAANRIALEVFEAHIPSLPLAFPRRIEHAQLVHPDDLPRFARAGVLASMQPSHLFIDLEILERCLPDRCERAFALASLRQAGVEIAFGSDAPIENPDPRRGLFAAVARTRLDGHPEGGWHRAEALRIGDAIDAYTRGGAVAAGVEHRQGTIAPGADADLVVLDRDPGTIQTTEILEMGVRRTLVAGRDTHVA